MSTDQILWLLAAISFFIGGLAPAGLLKASPLLSSIQWMLVGFGFIALTFVFN